MQALSKKLYHYKSGTVFEYYLRFILLLDALIIGRSL